MDGASPDKVEEFQREVERELTRYVGVARSDATPREWLRATSLAVRGRIVERWHAMNARVRAAGNKQVCYLSMEFLVARQLESALLATGLRATCAEALRRFGVSLDDLIALEAEPALGNGGLGRLAACFLEAMACRGVTGFGYGIRYEFGMFRQEIADGWQVEQPDDWLTHRNEWELDRPESGFSIGFGGHVEHHDGRAIWLPAESVIAIAHDLLVPGYRNETVNTLRLWGARPVTSLDLGKFNRGNFLEALAPKIRSKTVTRLLYPDDSTDEGRELRLRQEHFFASASVQDLLARFQRDHGPNWECLPDKVAVHLNDTHPALAPAEMMRQLVDVHALPWERAFGLTTKVFSYTNHTLMPEALEVWHVDMMRRIAPRHLEIIEEINRRLALEVGTRSDIRTEQLAVVSGEHARSVNMGRFSVLMSRRVNGVSELHSRLVRNALFPEFDKLYPDRFCNITNGISPRLWLFQSNPGLCALADSKLGDTWREPLDLTGIGRFADDAAFRKAFQDVKLANKHRLAKAIKGASGIRIDTGAMIDVQVKRIHEYKRQLLNIIGVIARWNAMKAEPHADWPARAVLIAGKAASSYWLAKLIIKLAHDVGQRINNDPDTSDRLKLIFLPNYNVSLAEAIMPAADLSQQISLAGTEASGTGNMKLALNGALTLGTRDGANIEIGDAIGQDGMFAFGLSVEEAAALKQEGYAPQGVLQNDERLRTVIEQIARGDFSPGDPHRFEPIIDALLNRGDRFMVLADFADYWRAQREVDVLWGDPDAWVRSAINSTANMGRFSADRAIDEYAQSIWRTGNEDGTKSV
jgi:starch phosphorylase